LASAAQLFGKFSKHSGNWNAGRVREMCWKSVVLVMFLVHKDFETDGKVRATIL